MLLELVLGTSGAFKKLNSQLGSINNRERWRILTQARCALMAITLRACERALGSAYAGRDRGEDRGWIMFAYDDKGRCVPVVKIGPSHPKRFADFEQPLGLTVLEPALFDVAVFEAWRRDEGARRQRRRASSRAPVR